MDHLDKQNDEIAAMLARIGVDPSQRQDRDEFADVEELARQMFLDPKKAAELTATARLPAVIRASIGHANALKANALNLT